MEEKIRTYYPGWTLMRKVGEGSFGAVYEIARTHYGVTERAAVKIITIPQKKSDIEALYSDGYDTESIAQRYLGYKNDIVREYTTMAMLGDCPNVVHGIDHAEILHPDGIGWDILILMELLTPLTKCHGLGCDDTSVIKMGKDLCNALIECKNHGIIHRDIKPQNIFVSENGTFKLGDFGIAKNVERTTGGTKIGTYGYMAPEVYFSRPYGSAADIYSLGLVLYWMLNEHRGPFLPLPPQAPTAGEEAAARRRRFSGEPLPPPANGSEELKQIILKACAWDTKERYHSAQEMYDALAALENTAVPVWEQWLDDARYKPVKKKKAKEVNLLLIIMAAVVSVAALAVGAWLLIGSLDLSGSSSHSVSHQAGENMNPEELLYGTWETTVYQDSETIRAMLENMDFLPEEIALVDLNHVGFVVIAEFKEDATYRFAVDAEATKGNLLQFYNRAFDSMYENREALTGINGYEMLTMTLPDFRQYYAELYGESSMDLLLDSMVENSFDYDILQEDFEQGTFRVAGDSIYCTVAGETKEKSITYSLQGDTLTLTYSDGVEIYTRQ